MKRLPIVLALLAVAAPLMARPTRITGLLLGSDKRPMRAANVHLLGSDQRTAVASVTAAADGHFTLETEMAGMLTLQFTGADHRSHQVKVLAGTTPEVLLNVSLATYEYPKDLDSVKVIGDFNDFDFSTGRPLKKGKDGTYSATFKTKSKTFVYQLVFPAGMRSWSMNGTASESFIYDGGGDYRSVLTPKKGSVTVTFDPARLVASAAEPTVSFKDPFMHDLAGIMENIDAREEKSIETIRERMRKGQDLSDWSYDWSAEIARLKGAIETETNPMIRGAQLISYIWLGNQGAMNLDSTMAQRALKELSPTSPLWGINPSLIGAATILSGTPAAYDNYLWSAIKENPDTSVRLKSLYGAVQNISYEKEPERFYSFYNYLTGNYPASFEAKYARAEYSPTRNIMLGKAIPAFSMTSLDDPAVTITNESMKGKVYLIDFWATWCGPCVSEMGNLHNAYEKYHAKNFEIVSFSFDRSTAPIGSFRKGKWKMPWMHAFVDGAFNSDLAERFEVMVIPKPILVDADGRIIATENDLRGPALERTLERVLGDKDVSAK